LFYAENTSRSGKRYLQKDTKKISPEGCREIDYRRLTVMQYQNSKTRFSRALTLVEMLIAMAIMAIIFAAILPQFRAIQNSWDSKQAAAETLQNSRVLMDHLYRNFSKAVKITAVSDSAETNGYIEFEDNDANNMRYDINADNYVEFGPVGDLYELAGPVSQLLFTCYDGNDFDTVITDVNDIRFIKVQTTLTNPAAMGRDITFTAQAYIRTNANPDTVSGDELTMGTPYEHNTSDGQEPALAKIDDEHYLCAYRGPGHDGWAVVLTVNTGTWTVSKETAFEFDTKDCRTPALYKIDNTHYLCAYEGEKDDGWINILKVDTGNWTITEEDHFEFDQDKGTSPALAQIDQSHYLCAYQGDKDDGWAVVLAVSEPLFDALSMETPFEFDTQDGRTPALCKIDDEHYLCAYRGPGTDGWAVVLTVDTGDWSISKEMAYEYDTSNGETPALSQIDSTHYLCAYEGPGDDGWAVVLTVNTGNWTISKGTAFEYDNSKGKVPALAQIDDDHFLCAYQGDGDDGWAVVLTVDTDNWTISKGTALDYDTSQGTTPALAEIDNDNCLCAYTGRGDDGWAVVLSVTRQTEVRP